MRIEIILGSVVKDEVTGFTGTAVARVEYLNGCVQYEVRPRMNPKKPGEMFETCWIDEQQLKVTKRRLVTNRKPTGGPGDKPPGMSSPR